MRTIEVLFLFLWFPASVAAHVLILAVITTAKSVRTSCVSQLHRLFPTFIDFFLQPNLSMSRFINVGRCSSLLTPSIHVAASSAPHAN
ncbi:hypothetical protein L2E82_27642 [Cichorium intybus]|uniref:Uncharacterized protein n=1 Tax=Cichorium intybus TaxID=13427 RepID=A0ACB9CTF0_CICIN|nr:hypothetical protein L2E82_27642 [Cichorium intybus]